MRQSARSALDPEPRTLALKPGGKVMRRPVRRNRNSAETGPEPSRNRAGTGPEMGRWKLQSTRKKRLKQTTARNRLRAVPPTRQTVAKLKTDIITRLYGMGRIEDHHAHAAHQIRTVFEAVGRSMFPVLDPEMWTGKAPRKRAGRDFLDRMTERERHLWQHHYLPWTREMAVEIAAGLPGVRWLQLVIDVVVENLTLREVEQRYRLAHGKAFEFVKSGLEKYARHARLI